MERKDLDPRNKPGRQAGPSYENPADETSRREGGDDALAETNTTDSRADEKVIVNEQREHKTVNAPSQTAVNTSEGISSDEDAIDNS